MRNEDQGNFWRLMWRLTGIVLILLFIYVSGHSQPIYWYNGTTRTDWTLKKDVLVIRTTSAHLSDLHIKSQTNVKIEREQGNTWLLTIHEAAGENLTRELVSRFNERNAPYIPLPAVMKAGESDDAPYLVLDDKVKVVLRKGKDDRSAIQQLCTRYNLELLVAPPITLPDGGDYVYIFRVKSSDLHRNSARISADLFEKERSLIKYAAPVRLNAYSPAGSPFTNDDFYDKLWHVENTAQPVWCYNKQGIYDADTDVDKVWEAGFTGSGIRVGIVDFDGFNYFHPDLQGQFLPGWDCITNNPYNQSNFYYNGNNRAHGMAVAGLIGAVANNGLGSAGVAYGAKLVPFLINQSDASVIIALQQALTPEYACDILNLSFGSPWEGDTIIHHAIKNCIRFGRMINGQPYGMVLVASHGNEALSDKTAPRFPSYYDEVISVAASTPEDKLKTVLDGWETNPWGSNYGEKVDIAAPGVCLLTTDYSENEGYWQNNAFTGFSGTSAAAPLVSAACALILSKNRLLHWQTVKQKLIEGADKVNDVNAGGIYDYNSNPLKPGHNEMMGYGRLNIYRAMQLTPVGYSIPSLTAMHPFINYQPMHDGFLFSGELSDITSIEITDLNGRVLGHETVSPGMNRLYVKTSPLPAGMYFARLSNNQGDGFYTLKLTTWQP